MSAIEITSGTVLMPLTSARSKIRICDNSGNHISKPTICNYSGEHYIEWMITNDEISLLADAFLMRNDLSELILMLDRLNLFLCDSEYRVRRAEKTRMNSAFADFDVYKYDESFYSFEKEIDGNLIARITFKMGDYTLAAHMFILFPFNNTNILFRNNSGVIVRNSPLGSGATASWTPTKKQIKDIIIVLAHSSSGHRDDLKNILQSKL